MGKKLKLWELILPKSYLLRLYSLNLNQDTRIKRTHKSLGKLLSIERTIRGPIVRCEHGYEYAYKIYQAKQLVQFGKVIAPNNVNPKYRARKIIAI